MNKRLLTLIALLFSGFVSSAQVKLTEVKNENLVYILGHIDTIIKRDNNAIGVSIYKISNPSGSAHTSETDEISNRYLISTSEFGEGPEQHLFNIGDFYNPKILKIESLKSNDFRVVIEYGAYNKRKKVSLNISLKKVRVTPV